MPENKDLKRLVRARMAATGERYTEALACLEAEWAAEREVAATATLAPLPGWIMAGGAPADYEFGLAAVTHEGLPVARLQARHSSPASFGTMMQTMSASQYRATRLRLNGLIRTHEVDWAALWLRIDGPSGTLAFDNMRHHAPRGTADWTEAEVVLDVPEHATTVNFGLLLVGAGAAHVARLHLATVDETVALTGRDVDEVPDSPQNLDFVAAVPGD
jgi:hypothetical protein